VRLSTVPLRPPQTLNQRKPTALLPSTYIYICDISIDIIRRIYDRVIVNTICFYIFFPPRPTLNGSVVSAAAASHEFLSDPDQVSPETTTHTHTYRYTLHTRHMRPDAWHFISIHCMRGPCATAAPNIARIYVYYNYCGPSNLWHPRPAHIYINAEYDHNFMIISFINIRDAPIPPYSAVGSFIHFPSLNARDHIIIMI